MVWDQVASVGIAIGSKIVGSFVGMQEPESWVKQIIPLASPYVQQTGYPVAAYWYGYHWALLPNGQTVDLNGGVKQGDVAYNKMLVQAFANTIQTPVARIRGVFDPPVFFDVTYPEKQADADTPVIVPVSASHDGQGVPVIQTTGYTAAPTGGDQEVSQAGFFGGDMSGMKGILGVAAMAGLLAFVMSRK